MKLTFLGTSHGVPAADRSQVAVVHTKPRGQVIWVENYTSPLAPDHEYSEMAQRSPA